jgi:hypothetical protein
MTVSSLPNFFVIYGPQAPTAFGNGPSAMESRADWIIKVLESMREDGRQRTETTVEAEKTQKELVMHFSALSLRHRIPSGWNGGNVLGKVQEALSFVKDCQTIAAG